ncbi:MAG: TrkH family potassium uptake protein [Roseinatronobacter sp.]|nr:TrkH family potassium uptake protein [Roseinatronobacter sp.]
MSMQRKAQGPLIMVALIGVTAMAMLLPAAVGFTLREHALARAFLYSAALLGSLAGMIYLAARANPSRDGALSHPFSILTLAYLLLPALMAVPLTEAIPGMRFGDAWFEMLSAFTTTGASLLEGTTSRSVDLWRATVAWGGGLFVVVCVMALLVPFNLGGVELLRGQIGGAMRVTEPGQAQTNFQESDESRNLQRLRDQVSVIAPAYLGITLVLWVGLSMAGNPPLVALMLAMSTLSTSGIVPVGVSTSVPSEILIALVLVFALSRRLWPGARALSADQSPKRQDPELMLAAVIVALIVLALVLHALIRPGPGGFVTHLADIWAHGFTALSFLTTTGFVSSASGGLSQVFSGPAGLMLMGLALFGGGVATTAGGLKLMRVFALGWQARREVSKLVYPDSVGGDGPRLRSLRREGAFAAWLFLMIFIFALTSLTAGLTLAGLTLEKAAVFAVAALTTTGPLPLIAAAEPLYWGELGEGAKILLGFGMLLGRLELLLLLSVLWRR